MIYFEGWSKGSFQLPMVNRVFGDVTYRKFAF
jgi:hypothetical protein